MEIVATRRNRKIDAIKGSKFFKPFVTSRCEKNIHHFTYPLAYL